MRAYTNNLKFSAVNTEALLIYYRLSYVIKLVNSFIITPDSRVALKDR